MHAHTVAVLEVTELRFTLCHMLVLILLALILHLYSSTEYLMYTVTLRLLTPFNELLSTAYNGF
jgi:hypothetical protein